MRRTKRTLKLEALKITSFITSTTREQQAKIIKADVTGYTWVG